MSDILLKTATGTTKRYTAQEIPDLKKDATFITAEITRGTYIFMEYKDFDQNGAGESKLLADKSQVHDISNVNGSFYCLPDVDKGIVLFTHGRFRGNHQVTNYFPNFDLTDLVRFPFETIYHLVSLRQSSKQKER